MKNKCFKCKSLFFIFSIAFYAMGRKTQGNIHLLSIGMQARGHSSSNLYMANLRKYCFKYFIKGRHVLEKEPEHKWFTLEKTIVLLIQQKCEIANKANANLFVSDALRTPYLRCQWGL